MIEWLWQNADTVSALVAIAVVIAPLLVAGVRRVLLSKRRFDKVMSVLDPEQGPALGDVLQTLLSGMKKANTDIDTLKSGTQDNTEMIADISAGLRAFTEDDHDPIFEADANGAWTYANPAMLLLIERPWSEVEGRGWELIVPALDREHVVKGFSAARASERLYDEDFVAISKHGNRYLVHCTAKPKRCRMGVIRGYIGRFTAWTPENVPSGIVKPH